MDDTQSWYLQKHSDETIFGPISLAQLRQWALEAQVSPLDKISSDGANWVKAPMIPELEMDYLIEVGPEEYYGPTSFGAIREFLQVGEINLETEITNCRDGTKSALKDLPAWEQQEQQEEEPGAAATPERTHIRAHLQRRIRELEAAIMEERRAREHAERMVDKLEAKLAEISRAAAQ